MIYILGIFPNSGKLYNEISFSQMERREPYTLHIIARDGGVPGRTDTCVVTIRVRDENDNIPVFNQSVFTITVQENVLNGQEVISVHT